MLICSLFSAMDSSKVCLKPSCSSMSDCADSTMLLFVARSIFAFSILFLSSVYSGPIFSAISLSVSAISLSLTSRSASSLAFVST